METTTEEEEATRLGTANAQIMPPLRNYMSGYSFPTEKLKQSITDDKKIPLVLVACGSFSPITYLHLRMFEMAKDYIIDQEKFELLGGYFSPVSDGYGKKGLAYWKHRVNMCDLAVKDNSWVMVDSWEPSQQAYVRTAAVLDHFDKELNHNCGGVSVNGVKKRISIMLLAGGDLIQSFAIPNLWAEKDLDHILGSYGCFIIERKGADVYDFLLQNDHLHRYRKSVFVVKQSIHNDISSTKLRLFVRRGMSIKYLLPDSVMDYIHIHALYH